MHELLSGAYAQLTVAGRILAASSGSEPVKVALITGAFLLAGTVITVLGQRRDRGSEQGQQRVYRDQVRRAERAEARCEQLGAENTRLRELVRALGHDPDEDPDEVRAPA